MVVKIKKLVENAVIPAYSKKGDAGLDLTAVSKTIDENSNIVYGTGLAVEIPEGFVGLLFPRSSNSKTDLYLTNHVGVVDSGYRGEIMFKF
jgi:dUTP pyrophosphatase